MPELASGVEPDDGPGRGTGDPAGVESSGESSPESSPESGPASGVSGTVVDFDDAKGFGTVRSDDGLDRFFHCTAIADGTRTIAVGAAVRYDVVAGRLGRYEAAGLRPA